jgi:hypothetical protein
MYIRILVEISHLEQGIVYGLEARDLSPFYRVKIFCGAHAVS